MTTDAPALELVLVPLDKIDPHPDNVRHDLGDLTELAKSVEGQGIIEPCVVCRQGDDNPDRFWTVAGHRRIGAAELAKLTHVPCTVRPEMPTAEIISTMLAENLQRTDITAIEEARGYARLIELGTKVPEISRRVGRSQQLVKDRLALTQLPNEALDAVEEGRTTIGRALEMVKHAGDPEAMEWLADQYRRGRNPMPNHLSEHLHQREKSKVLDAELAKLAKAKTIRFTPPSSYYYVPDHLRDLNRAHPVSVLHLKDARSHSKESCHAVYVAVDFDGDSRSGTIAYKATRTTMCMEPKRHTTKVRPAERSKLQIPTQFLPEEPTAPALDPEAVAAKEACAGARDARHAFALTLLATDELLPLPDVALQAAITVLSETENLEDVAAWALEPDDRAVLEALEPQSLLEWLYDIHQGPRVVKRWDRWVRADWFHTAECRAPGWSTEVRAEHSLFVTYLEHLIAEGYEPAPWDVQTMEAYKAAIAEAPAIDVDAMELDPDTATVLLAIREACVADPAMGHGGEDLDDTCVEDALQRKLIEIDNQADGPRITLTDAGSAVVEILAERAGLVVDSIEVDA